MAEKTESSEKTAKKTTAKKDEQKLASGERLVAKGGASGLAKGPSQDDLNPAYAPPKVDADNA